MLRTLSLFVLLAGCSVQRESVTAPELADAICDRAFTCFGGTYADDCTAFVSSQLGTAPIDAECLDEVAAAPCDQGFWAARSCYRP